MRVVLILFAFLFFLSCNTQHKTVVTGSDETLAGAIPEPGVYRSAYTRFNDLEHTRLEVKFDFVKKQLLGKANITLHPHFRATDQLRLNARGMELHEVSLVNGDGTRSRLSYTYNDGKVIHITLDRVYKMEENYTVFIDYTSKPEELPEGGSLAIRRDKGLYFINADGSNPEKPKQVWTQGETESNSVWFPTIEDPQQKMTQEIYITVDTSLTTVSNGLLLTSTDNNDGTRTDYWKQSLPAPPYLTMIAASNFAVVKDKWKNIEVNYYLDQDYSKYAKMIFGLTPEMIGYFSTLLGVEYPWEKYAQVVVHDFVSGAMENTTAVVHGTNMLQDSSDFVDGNYEDYISHELFHHWFGDLVTCESWSNITLNESFANYAEYIWDEYKHGREYADRRNQTALSVYLMIAKSADPALVRFDYEDKEDVYDAVSYNKGGRILHMLRKYVGDEAFYASLKRYLEQHKFGAAEAQELRLAFEQVTGEDLNWFFNQWYYKGGHPVIEVNYEWIDSSGLQVVTIEQKQDFKKNPLYRIPLQTDVYHDGTVDHKKIVLEHAKEVFQWKFDSKPELVNIDAERMLLADMKDNKTGENYVFQYYHAPLYLDRFEALNKTGSDYAENSPAGKMMEDGLADRSYHIRALALKNIGTQLKANRERLKPVLMKMVSGDSAAAVRMQAIKTLGKYFKDDEEVKMVIANAVKDISYNVQAAAFKFFTENDKVKASELAPMLEHSNGSDVLNAVAAFYVEEALETSNDFYLDAMSRLRSYGRGIFAGNYAKYLKKVKKQTWEKGVDKLEETAGNSSGSGRKLILNAMEDLAKDLGNKSEDAGKKAEELKNNNGGQNEIALAERERADLLERQKALRERIRKLGEKAETSFD